MIGRALVAVSRTTLEPALIRLGALAAGLVALLVALPSGTPPLLQAAAMVLAALPALAPRGPFVTMVVLASVAGWLADTGITVVAGGPELGPAGGGLAGGGLAGQVPDLGRLLVLAGALYLVHALAALAAALPHDAVVSPQVVAGWLLRALAVVVSSAVLSVAVLAGIVELTGRTGGRTYAVASLAGLAVAVAAAALLTRRPRLRA